MRSKLAEAYSVISIIILIGFISAVVVFGIAGVVTAIEGHRWVPFAEIVK